MHDEDRVYSWWDYRAGDFHQGRGLRIDLLMCSASVAERGDVVRHRSQRPQGQVPERPRPGHRRPRLCDDRLGRRGRMSVRPGVSRPTNRREHRGDLAGDAFGGDRPERRDVGEFLGGRRSMAGDRREVAIGAQLGREDVELAGPVLAPVGEEREHRVDPGATMSSRRGSGLGLAGREAGEERARRSGVAGASLGVRDDETIGGPRHGDVEQPSLLLRARRRSSPTCAARGSSRRRPGSPCATPDPSTRGTSAPRRRRRCRRRTGSSSPPRPGTRHRRRAASRGRNSRMAAGHPMFDVAHRGSSSRLGASSVSWAQARSCDADPSAATWRITACIGEPAAFALRRTGMPAA